MLRILIGILVAFSIAGCATDLETARKLSSSGVAVGDQLVAGSQEIRSDWYQTQDRVEVRRYLARAMASPSAIKDDEILSPGAHREDIDKQIDAVGGLLGARFKVFSELEKLYVGFDDLTKFDATQSFNSQYQSLIGDLKNYQTKLPEEDAKRAGSLVKQLTGDSATVVAAGTGFLQRQMHWRNIEKANKKISKALAVIIALYEADMRYVRSIRLDSSESTANLLSTLSEAGLIDETPRLAEVTELADAKPAKKPETLLARRPRLRIAIDGYSKLKVKRRKKLIENAEDATLKAMKALEKSHETLGMSGEEGRLERLAVEISALQLAVKDLRKGLKADNSNNGGN